MAIKFSITRYRQYGVVYGRVWCSMAMVRTYKLELIALRGVERRTVHPLPSICYSLWATMRQVDFGHPESSAAG